MSYEVVKNIRIDHKHQKIFVNSSCNNITPKYYYTKEFEPNNFDFEQKKYNLFYYVLTGEFHIDKCKNEQYYNAFENFRNYLFSKNLRQQDLWDYSKDSEELKNYYNIFNSYFEQKINLEEQDLGM